MRVSNDYLNCDSECSRRLLAPIEGYLKRSFIKYVEITATIQTHKEMDILHHVEKFDSAQRPQFEQLRGIYRRAMDKAKTVQGATQIFDNLQVVVIYFKQQRHIYGLLAVYEDTKVVLTPKECRIVLEDLEHS